jgi:hypothetical protein
MSLQKAMMVSDFRIGEAKHRVFKFDGQMSTTSRKHETAAFSVATQGGFEGNRGLVIEEQG